jgi:predicted enzyme related to lactoylglutathione lyase
VDITLNFDCNDLDRMEAFWTAALDYERRGAFGAYRAFQPAAGAQGPKLILQQVPEGKSAKNRLHLDLDHAPDFDIEAEADRLVALGGRRLSGLIDEIPGASWIVMADPEGNEFCICRG